MYICTFSYYKKNNDLKSQVSVFDVISQRIHF